MRCNYVIQYFMYFTQQTEKKIIQNITFYWDMEKVIYFIGLKVFSNAVQ
jgi:hypothetical protein